MTTMMEINKAIARLRQGSRIIIESVQTDDNAAVIYVRCGSAVEIVPRGGDVCAAIAQLLRVDASRPAEVAP